jgi:integrase
MLRRVWEKCGKDQLLGKAVAVMASVSYRRGGWELRYRDRRGNEHTERFAGPLRKRPPAEAVDRKAAVEHELRHGRYVAPEERRVTFAEYYQRWQRGRRPVSATRQYTDDNRAGNHVLPYWNDWALCDIRPSDIDDWVAQLSRKMGPSAVRHCYTLLRGPLRRAVKDGLITDPCIDIVLPKKPDISKGFDDVLNAEEVFGLIAAVPTPGDKYEGLRTNKRYQALVEMGCWLGPRWNEAIGVRICDLNPLRGEMAFGRVVVNQNGNHCFTEEMSKTDDARIVPVPAPVMVSLQKHIRTYLPKASRTDFLFTNRGGEFIKRSNFSRDVLKPALSRAGLGERRITWVSLRHTAASLMFDAGLTLFDVQRRLGHKSPMLTAEVYTHLMRERFEEGRARMEEYMRLHASAPGLDARSVGLDRAF